MKLRIHRLAVAEIDHEVDYYESCSVKFGAELEDEIDAVLETILQFPQAAPQWRDRPDRRVAGPRNANREPSIRLKVASHFQPCVDAVDKRQNAD